MTTPKQLPTETGPGLATLGTQEAMQLSRYQVDRNVHPMVCASAGAKLAAISLAAMITDPKELNQAVEILCETMRVCANQIINHERRLASMQ